MTDNLKDMHRLHKRRGRILNEVFNKRPAQEMGCDRTTITHSHYLDRPIDKQIMQDSAKREHMLQNIQDMVMRKITATQKYSITTECAVCREDIRKEWTRILRGRIICRFCDPERQQVINRALALGEDSYYGA